MDETLPQPWDVLGMRATASQDTCLFEAPFFGTKPRFL